MAQIIQLSEAASIALHSVAFMARNAAGTFTVKEIAEKSGASENHLSKVMQRLNKAGILSSTRGPKGGFSLAKPLENITMLDVYEAIEGRISGDDCPLNHNECPFESCAFGGVLRSANAQLAAYFKETTLADIAQRGML